jgi:hypothetical protein
MGWAYIATVGDVAIRERILVNVSVLIDTPSASQKGLWLMNWPNQIEKKNCA